MSINETATAKEEFVTIRRSEYRDLLDSQFKLNCLENGGVDNWTFYYDSLKDGGYFDDED